MNKNNPRFINKFIPLGELSALRQVKKDITEAKKGLECGMSFEGFNDFQPGDVIQSVQTIETKQKL
jgi:translation initiation factor IF-2